MKVLPVFTLLFCLLCGFSDNSPEIPSPVIRKANFDTTACSPFYEFDGAIFNLETLEQLDAEDGIPATQFKQCSPYAYRFTNPISDTLLVNGVKFAIENSKEKKKYRLHISGKGVENRVINLPVQNPLPEVHEYYFFMVPFQKEVILVMSDFYSTHYTLCKYDAEGRELMRDSVEHTYVTHPNPNTNHHHPYLTLKAVTKNELVFSSHAFYADTTRTVVFSMNDFSKREFSATANGILCDEQEEHVAGFVTHEDNDLEVTLLDGRHALMEIPHLSRASSIILRGDLLYIADYHPISTGSALHCYSLLTRKQLWKADVAQVNATHSEYENHVVISLYKNRIVMEGIESSGHYLQVFDAETGARLAKWGSFWDLDHDR